MIWDDPASSTLSRRPAGEQIPLTAQIHYGKIREVSLVGNRTGCVSVRKPEVNPHRSSDAYTTKQGIDIVTTRIHCCRTNPPTNQPASTNRSHSHGYSYQYNVSNVLGTTKQARENSTPKPTTKRSAYKQNLLNSGGISLNLGSDLEAPREALRAARSARRAAWRIVSRSERREVRSFA